MAKKKSNTHYLVRYRDPANGDSVSIKAKEISDSSLGLSFISIADFIFDTQSIVVNPNEEAKKLEFENVKTLHLSIYSILSISEVGEHDKSLSFKHDKAKLLVLNQDVKEEHPN